MALILTRYPARPGEGLTPQNAIIIRHGGEELLIALSWRPSGGEKSLRVLFQGAHDWDIVRAELCEDVTLEAEA